MSNQTFHILVHCFQLFTYRKIFDHLQCVSGTVLNGEYVMENENSMIPSSLTLHSCQGDRRKCKMTIQMKELQIVLNAMKEAHKELR